MQKDFHYYATYCAASLAGYTPEESTLIATSAQFVDCCTGTMLSKLHAPVSAATTQSGSELLNTRTNIIGLQNITRIWSSFHFLPRDLYSDTPRASRLYRQKYHLICGPNGDLVSKTVQLAKDRGPVSAGLAMHVLADTWAHQNFAGTPSQVINDTNFQFYEILEKDGVTTERPIHFRHSASPDDIENGRFTNSINDSTEKSVMVLGHGRAGHLPDYSYITYRYMPAWKEYEFIIKNNPEDYMHAFRQMVTAMKYLHGDIPEFTLQTYDTTSVDPWSQKIEQLLKVRRTDACDDWEALGEEISGRRLKSFDIDELQNEYEQSPGDSKDDTFLGQFILAAMRQKSMVTGEIFRSGNLLTGFSTDYAKFGFKGIRDYKKLLEASEKGR